MSNKDNPHYVTPEEAEEKRCVEAPDVWHCRGPECMAWRWGIKYNYLKDEDRHEVAFSKTHGYCGLVDK
jgi:hypothetical protein